MNSTNLLVINYAMDEKHQVFSHQIDLVNKLASHFNSVTVLTGHVGVCRVSDNVRVVNFGWVEGRHFLSLFKFLRIFIDTIRIEKYSVLFSHMTSVHSALISPFTKVLKIKHFLWYAHTSNSLHLRFSKFFINGVITSTAGSCPLKGKKIYPIGQSIDQTKFKKSHKVNFPIKNLIHVGRLDPSKNVDLIIKTVENLRKTQPNLTLEIVGSPSTGKYIEYAQNLTSEFSSTKYNSWLKFTEYIQRSDIPRLLRTKDGFIHGFQGSLDKVLLEATFSGLPVITVNKEYLKIFGSWGTRNSHLTEQTIESEARELLNMPVRELSNEIVKRLEIAVLSHESMLWSERLVAILKS